MDWASNTQPSNSIIVSNGDTLSQIAHTYGTTVNELVEANGITNPDLIYIGQEIHIPTVSSNSGSSNDDSSGPTSDFSYLSNVSSETEDDATETPAYPPDIPIEQPILPIVSEDNTDQSNSDSWPEPIPLNNRFNDLTGDQSDIHGFDLSSNDESDALYGYLGEDHEGAWVAGTGLVDFENSDDSSWLSGFEILTAEGKGNIIGTFEQDEFWGAEFDAQVIEADFDIKGHGLNVGYLNADGNYGGDPDGFGLLFNANIADVTYSNGAPSADNDNDIGFDFGLSAGLGGGLNVVYSDPDNDGRTNLGFDLSAGPVDIGLTSEYLGQKAESGLEAAGGALVDKIYEVNNAVDDVVGWFSGGGIFG